MPWIFSLAFPIHIDIYIGSIPHCAKEFQIYTLLIWPYTEISFKIQKPENPTRVLRLVGVTGFEPAASCSQMCVGTFKRHSAALFGPFLCSGSLSLTLFCPACFKQNFLLLGWVWDWILYIKRSSVRGEQKRQAESPQRGRRKCAA